MSQYLFFKKLLDLFHFCNLVWIGHSQLIESSSYTFPAHFSVQTLSSLRVREVQRIVGNRSASEYRIEGVWGTQRRFESMGFLLVELKNVAVEKILVLDDLVEFFGVKLIL